MPSIRVVLGNTRIQCREVYVTEAVSSRRFNTLKFHTRDPRFSPANIGDAVTAELEDDSGETRSLAFVVDEVEERRNEPSIVTAHPMTTQAILRYLLETPEGETETRLRTNLRAAHGVSDLVKLHAILASDDPAVTLEQETGEGAEIEALVQDAGGNNLTGPELDIAGTFNGVERGLVPPGVGPDVEDDAAYRNAIIRAIASRHARARSEVPLERALLRDLQDVTEYRVLRERLLNYGLLLGFDANGRPALYAGGYPVGRDSLPRVGEDASSDVPVELVPRPIGVSPIQALTAFGQFAVAIDVVRSYKAQHTDASGFTTAVFPLGHLADAEAVSDSPYRDLQTACAAIFARVVNRVYESTAQVSVPFTLAHTPNRSIETPEGVYENREWVCDYLRHELHAERGFVTVMGLVARDPIPPAQLALAMRFESRPGPPEITAFYRRPGMLQIRVRPAKSGSAAAGYQPTCSGVDAVEGVPGNVTDMVFVNLRAGTTYTVGLIALNAMGASRRVVEEEQTLSIPPMSATSSVYASTGALEKVLGGREALLTPAEQDALEAGVVQDSTAPVTVAATYGGHTIVPVETATGRPVQNTAVGTGRVGLVDALEVSAVTDSVQGRPAPRTVYYAVAVTAIAGAGRLGNADKWLRVAAATWNARNARRRVYRFTARAVTSAAGRFARGFSFATRGLAATSAFTGVRALAIRAGGSVRALGVLRAIGPFAKVLGPIGWLVTGASFVADLRELGRATGGFITTVNVAQDGYTQTPGVGSTPPTGAFELHARILRGTTPLQQAQNGVSGNGLIGRTTAEPGEGWEDQANGWFGVDLRMVYDPAATRINRAYVQAFVDPTWTGSAWDRTVTQRWCSVGYATAAVDEDGQALTAAQRRTLPTQSFFVLEFDEPGGGALREYNVQYRFRTINAGALGVWHITAPVPFGKARI